MKKKKAALAAILAVIVLIIGAIGAVAAQYFAEQGGRSGAGGELAIDYYVSEQERAEAEEGEQSSKNIFQWLIDKLSADKEEPGEVLLEEGGSGTTSSGMSQNRKDSEEDAGDGADEEAPIETPTASAAMDKDKDKKKDDQEPEEEGPAQTAPQEQPGKKEEEPEEETAGSRKITLSIRCDTAVDKGMNLESKWAGIVPSSGTILPATKMEFQEGDTVFDVLCRARDQYKFHLSYRGANGAQYIDGINNLYEFDGGRWSGWMFCVNDWYPNYGCGQYLVKDGDVIEWNYTCNLGRDLGQDWMASDEWMDANE